MASKASLVETIYAGIKAEITSGALLPGQRVDIAALCTRFGASKSPVRNILNRLVGEGLLEVQAHDGFYRPRVTEQRLRDLYQWNAQVLLLALDGAMASETCPDVLPPLPEATSRVDEAEHLFAAIAELGENGEFRRAIGTVNDRLRALRQQKAADRFEWADDHVVLRTAWQSADLPALRDGIVAYHARRLQLIPQIVALAYRDPVSRPRP